MTEGEILEGIRAREGDIVKNDPNDPADPSKFGISADTLGRWRSLNRRATFGEVNGLQWPEAQRIYRHVYIDDPGFIPQHIAFEPLRVQLIDFGVNSGPQRAIRWLQRVLQVHPSGTLDAVTLSALNVLHPAWSALLNDALVAARLYMIDSTTDTRPGYKKYEEGLEDRALSFFIAKP